MDPALAYQGISTGVDFVASLIGGAAQSKAAKANAKIAKQNAKNALATAAATESRVRRESALILGQQRVSYAKAGVQMTGTALDVAAQSAANAELDAMMARYAGTVEATNYRNQASGYRASAGDATTAAAIGAGNAILSGLTAWQRRQDQFDLLNTTAP